MEEVKVKERRILRSLAAKPIGSGLAPPGIAPKAIERATFT